MSEPKANTITLDIAARLVGVTPKELAALANEGKVRRVDKNAFQLPALVADFIAQLKAEHERERIAPKQLEIAAHLDLSDRSVREFLSDNGMDHRACSLDEIRVAYIRNLREQAAGRGGANVGELAAERARLAKEQADKIAMQNAVTRGELTPTAVLEQVLAGAAAKIAGILDAIPSMVRRRVPILTASDVDMIAGEVAKARNAVAAMSLSDLDVEVEDDQAAPVIVMEEAA